MPRNLKLEANDEINPGVSGFDEETLKQLCKTFIHDKTEADKWKKLASAGNEAIKKQMQSMNITSCSTDDGTVKMSERVSESFREDDLIAYLKENGVADNIVKTKEYVDMDALESAIYHETISKEIVAGMSKCKDKTVTLQLRVSKKGD